VKRELYWVPSPNTGVLHLRTAIPGDLGRRDMTIGYVERLPVHGDRPWRGALYKSHLKPPETCLWEVFETLAQAQAWVYSLAILEN